MGKLNYKGSFKYLNTVHIDIDIYIYIFFLYNNFFYNNTKKFQLWDVYKSITKGETQTGRQLPK